VAFLSAMRFDPGAADATDAVARQSSRPDFQALIYPGRAQRIEPATNSPAVFLVCGYNDRPDISEGLAGVYLKFKQLKVPAELHIYAGTGHGFGLRANNTNPPANGSNASRNGWRTVGFEEAVKQRWLRFQIGTYELPCRLGAARLPGSGALSVRPQLFRRRTIMKFRSMDRKPFRWARRWSSCTAITRLCRSRRDRSFRQCTRAAAPAFSNARPESFARVGVQFGVGFGLTRRTDDLMSSSSSGGRF